VRARFFCSYVVRADIFFFSLSPSSSHVAHVRYSRCERARHVVDRCAHCATDTTIHTCPFVRPFVRSFVRPASINVRKKKRYRGVWLGPPGRQSPVVRQGRIQSFITLLGGFTAGEACGERGQVASYLVTFLKGSESR